MNCSCCKKQIPDDSKFCQFCGSAVEETVQKPQPPVAIHADSQENTVIPGSIQDNSVPNLTKRGFLFLEDGMWKKANSYFEKALDIDIECAEAYLGKLLVELRAKTKEDLAKIEKEFDQKANYQKALRFSEGEFREELERLPLEWRYQKAIAAAKEKKYRQALERLEGIPDYRDAEQKCEEYLALQKEQNKRDQKTGIIVGVSSLFVFLVVVVVVYIQFFFIPSKKYNEAVSLAQAGEYAKAFDIFDSLDDYQDSEQQKEKMEIQLAAQAKVGDIIPFGVYEIDGNYSNGDENIAWRVLEKKNDRILVLSEDMLFSHSFKAETIYIHLAAQVEYEQAERESLVDLDLKQGSETGTWKNSYLRLELHRCFLYQAFGESLRDVLTIVTNKNPGDASSNDMVFLLTSQEVGKYFPDQETRKVGGSWLLRSPGKGDNSIEYIDKKGNIRRDGSMSKEYGIRPAMWIDISKAAG